MHFFVPKENLSKGLLIVGKGISSRTQLPILSNILLKVKNHQLILCSTNLELGISYSLPVKAESEGETTVSGKFLLEFINHLAAEKIEFFFDQGKKLLFVKTEKTKASFSTLDPNEFPSFPEIPLEKKTFSLERLKEAILRTVFAASFDETRPVLTGVKINLFEGKVSLVATDGYRLSLNEVEIEEKKEILKIILPAQSLLEVIRIAQEVKAENLGLAFLEKKNQLVFLLPNILVFTRIIEGEFPSVEKIIPQGFKTRVILVKEEFLQAVKIASLFARGAANIVKIKIEKEKIRISAHHPQLGENEVYLEGKIEGEEMETAFNYRFLLDLLTNFPDEEVVFESLGVLNPGVFKPVNKKISFLHLIMPVRIQE